MNKTNNVRRNRFGRLFLLLGILLLGMSTNSRAVAPTFTGGFSQTVPAQCGPILMSPYLSVNEATPGLTVTWTVIGAPSHGTLTTIPSAVSSGGVAVPASVFYTPYPGYSIDSGAEQITVLANDANGTAVSQIFITINPRPTITMGSMPNVCRGATAATIPYTGLTNVGPVSRTFSTVGNTTFTVPSGITSLGFDVQGAAGGSDNHSGAGTANPGKGGRVRGNLTVAAGQVLNIFVGGKGSDGAASGALGGFNGGGNANFYFFGCGGAGGGASDIRIGGINPIDRKIVAGGGARNGWDSPGPLAGGDGGNLIGGSSANNVGGGHSGGGTQSAGGAAATYTGWTPGTNGNLSVGGNGSVQGISGGGGGGYYGGGGGIWTGGGGGSSYTSGAVSSPTLTAGYNAGDGIVSLNYNIAGTYSIVWNAGAHTAGFTDTSALLSPSPITVRVPALAGAAATSVTYTGFLTVNNGMCTSSTQTITVTVNPIPNVAVSSPVPANQVVCNGDATVDVDFIGDVGANFNWTNDNTSIGLTASGVGHIAGFPGVNTTSAPVQSIVTVTPVAVSSGCVGAQITFTITVNPTPELSSTTLPAPVCDSMLFTLVQGSATAGTAITWTRAAVTGVLPATGSGSGNITEWLDDTTAGPVTVIYVDSLVANGCWNVQNVTVTVKPKPVLSTTLTPPAICDSTLFSYVPASLTSGTTFSWNRNAVAGIANAAAVGTGNPNEWLDDTTNVPVGVTYTYTLDAAGCVNMQNVVDTVYPTAKLSSPLSLPTICDSVLFTYNPTSTVANATFSWVRDTIPGIANPSRIGTGSISEYLYNTTAHPILVTYVYTTIANGCAKVQNVRLTVNPRPLLIGSLTQPAICDSTLFSYTPTSFTVGTVFAWHRDAMSGITNATASGFNNPNEVLHNTTPNPIIVTYVYTLSAYGCSYVQNVKVTVNPKPLLSSTLAPSAICDSATFSYTPSSATAGTAYRWYRAYVPGILNIAASGTGNPNEALINTTNVGVTVVYTYTISANGCNNTQKVTVAVNPTPLLTSSATASVCSGAPFTYTPASFTPGATFSWVRNSVPNITPATASGTGSISDNMTNGTLLPINVVYLYRLGINGCTNNHTDKVTVTVKAKPPVPEITIMPPSTLCSNTMYQNFGASSTVPVHYVWSATGATVWATGSTGQFAVVNFNTPGTAVVMVNANLPTVNCATGNTYTVTVGNSASDNPSVIFYDGQFICLQTNEDSYQWGYDDAGTLDSTLLAGETNQNYTNVSPDFAHKHYWVMTKVGGCMQKTYYNVPTGVTEVSDITGIKVYPNPANDVVNVDINTKIDGNIQVEVFNMLGQKVSAAEAVNHKARINISALPAGCYIVDCYRDGMKIAAARFIKN